jgi:nucleoside-diphosphate-sugar epimerase
MRALLIGGNGFIGCNLTEYLEKLEIKFDIIGRDTPMPIKFPSYELIFFLAGEVRKQADMYHTHVELLYKVLCRSLNINCVFVYVGSSSEYGRMDEPMTEEHPIKPTNMYEATKGIGTLLCQGFAKEFNRPILVVRPSSVYGKYERPEKLIPTIIRKIKSKEKVDIYHGWHDWIYVDDFINGIFTILHEVDPDKLDGEIYNISSARQHSNLEIANMIYNIMGEIPLITRHDENFHKHDCDCWLVDNSKIADLGWEQKYDIFEGLRKTVEEA